MLKAIKMIAIMVATMVILVTIIMYVKAANSAPYEIGEGITVGMTATVDNSIFLDTYAPDKVPENLKGKTVSIRGQEVYISDETAQIVEHVDGTVEVMY